MRHAIVALLVFLVPFGASASAPLDRRDGFLRIWQSIGRPADTVTKPSFADVPPDSPGFQVITYAERRGMLDAAEKFWPDAPLELEDALLWLFRTRSIDDVTHITADTVAQYLETYPIAHLPGNERASLTEDELFALMGSLDERLRSETHEVSLYSEKFHGKGTAFGETFDMNAMTAAHKYFPYNTLVEVTNRDAAKTVTVRINDRGPFVEGRDMDLSLGAFLLLSPRSAGVLHNVTFKRLGDASVVYGCGRAPVRQQRITKNVLLSPGVPRVLPLGESVSWSANAPYLLERITYPDGLSVRLLDWLSAGETYTLRPSEPGLYRFVFRSKAGKRREMEMKVVECI